MRSEHTSPGNRARDPLWLPEDRPQRLKERDFEEQDQDTGTGTVFRSRGDDRAI